MSFLNCFNLMVWHEQKNYLLTKWCLDSFFPVSGKNMFCPPHRYQQTSCHLNESSQWDILCQTHLFGNRLNQETVESAEFHWNRRAKHLNRSGPGHVSAHSKTWQSHSKQTLSVRSSPSFLVLPSHSLSLFSCYKHVSKHIVFFWPMLGFCWSEKMH